MRARERARLIRVDAWLARVQRQMADEGEDDFHGAFYALIDARTAIRRLIGVPRLEARPVVEGKDGLEAGLAR